MTLKLGLVLGFSFVIGQGIWRLSEQSKLGHIKTRIQDAKLVKFYDLRDTDRVMAVIRQRESESFKSRVQNKDSKIFYWPGLRSAHVSWVWMQALNGLHNESSFAGDYSWLFSKLNFITKSLPAEKDIRFISLAPFFLVIGVDGIGSTLMVRDMIQKNPRNWKTWFYAGYHAVENLKISNLAADYYEKCLKFEDSPEHLASLVLQLRDPDSRDNKTSRDLLLREMDPGVQERVKSIRPEWFQ
jgi:hypothetical protein